MARWEISVFCSEIHTKHIDTACWQHVEFFHVKLGGTYSGYWVFNYKERRIKSIRNSKQPFLCMISGFRREADEICALLGCYAAYGVNFLRRFRDNISVSSSIVKNLLKTGPIGCPETSVRN